MPDISGAPASRRRLRCVPCAGDQEQGSRSDYHRGAGHRNHTTRCLTPCALERPSFNAANALRCRSRSPGSTPPAFATLTSVPQQPDLSIYLLLLTHALKRLEKDRGKFLWVSCCLSFEARRSCRGDDQGGPTRRTQT